MSKGVVGEVEECVVEWVGDDGESLERGGGLIGVDFVVADKGVDSSEWTLPDDTVRERLHDDYFEGKDGLFAGGCSHGESDGGRICRKPVGDGVEPDVFEVSEG